MSGVTDDVERWNSAYHAPVLASEVLRLLHGAGRVLDGTLGGGGHTAALLNAGARVTALDRDPEALREAGSRLESAVRDGRLRLLEQNYADLANPDVLRGEQFDGILLDLGVSSHQLDDPGRGFSFREGAPLDMRMGSDALTDAATLLNESDERELMRIFREYGDEPRANRLAREIVRRRETEPFTTSDDLVRAIRGALGPRSGAPDFARLFQAVRIAVNDELPALERALPALRDRLTPGGTLAVIAYHSGEDRIVKHAFREWSRDCICPPQQPVCTCRGVALGRLLTRKAIEAASDEVSRNPRARSAKLRAWSVA
jgi:16S rRNA (cytosine1402-N4)-methyltransferase